MRHLLSHKLTEFPALRSNQSFTIQSIGLSPYFFAMAFSKGHRKRDSAPTSLKLATQPKPALNTKQEDLLAKFLKVASQFDPVVAKDWELLNWDLFKDCIPLLTDITDSLIGDTTMLTPPPTPFGLQHPRMSRSHPDYSQDYYLCQGSLSSTGNVPNMPFGVIGLAFEDVIPDRPLHQILVELKEDFHIRLPQNVYDNMVHGSKSSLFCLPLP